MSDFKEIYVELEDTEWPFTYTDHDRLVVRSIVIDDEGFFYFVRAERDDDFGVATLIETAGGGVEAGEDLLTAIRRELKEELGAEVEILAKLGVVSDYYNLVHRHNVNNYFLCRIRSFGERHLTRDEIESFHLSTMRITFEEALREYELRSCTRLGKLIANRELPALHRAAEILASDSMKDVLSGKNKQNPFMESYKEIKVLRTIGENFSGYWKRVRTACRGIVIRDGSILLSYETKTGLWMTPGGGLEQGESEASCVVRELAEETGLVVRPSECVLEIDEFYEDVKYVCRYFFGKIEGETVRKLTEQEIEDGLEPRWLPLPEAVRIFSAHQEYAATDEMRRGLYLREYMALTTIMESCERKIREEIS